MAFKTHALFVDQSAFCGRERPGQLMTEVESKVTCKGCLSALNNYHELEALGLAELTGDGRHTSDTAGDVPQRGVDLTEGKS